MPDTSLARINRNQKSKKDLSRRHEEKTSRKFRVFQQAKKATKRCPMAFLIFRTKKTMGASLAPTHGSVSQPASDLRRPTGRLPKKEEAASKKGLHNISENPKLVHSVLSIVNYSDCVKKKPFLCPGPPGMTAAIL